MKPGRRLAGPATNDVRMWKSTLANCTGSWMDIQGIHIVCQLPAVPSGA